MAHALTLWFGRFLASVRPSVRAQPSEPAPMKIEVERLPDYLWRDLGFPCPRRPEESELVHSAAAAERLSLLAPKQGD